MHLQKINNIFKILLFIPLLIYLGERSPIAFDEGYYILQSKWILNTGDWISPMYWGRLILDRTIGIQYLIALSQKIFGQNNFSIYIPNILAGSIMIFLTSEIHKELVQKKDRIISALILSTTFLWINYFHMATQDIIFASLVTFGLFSTIKAYKSEKNIYFFSSGIWIGLAVMLKTYLTIIPLIAILPFLISSKIIRKKSFWSGTFIGFIPFFIWSYNVINIYGFTNFSGLYSKLITLSKNNNFTNPFYYYLWNFPINILPWSVFAIIGFFKINKFKEKLSYFFLFKFPLVIVTLLSIFSTKTPYYLLQILPLISINSYIGLFYIFKNKNIFTSFFRKLTFLIFPISLLSLIIYINLKIENIGIERSEKYILSFALFIFAISWLISEKFESMKHKLTLIILGPYILFSISVQSGFLNDRSKDIRLASQEIIRKENLYNKKIEFITSGPGDEDSTSKLIRLGIFMPNIGEGIDDIKDLKINQYAWTTISNDEIVLDGNYKLIETPNIFKPWKLILRE